ncbi:MAG: TonB-dependent receptor [Saprospiraceae bacterium]
MKKMGVLLGALFYIIQIRAQDSVSVKSLNEIIVTANRFNQKSNSTGKIISIIDRNELHANAGKSVAEIIQSYSGGYINGANGVQGSNKEFYLRGASHGNVLIVMDGIVVHDPSQINNSFDLNHLNVYQIDHIEILKGAQSTLWGSDAVAGVINIISKKSDDKKISADAVLAAGSYASIRSNVGIHGNLGQLSYRAGYARDKSHGFSAATDAQDLNTYDKDGYKQDNVQLSLQYRLNKNFNVSTLIHGSIYHTDIDAGGFADDKDYTTKNKNLLGNVQLSYQQSRLKLYFNHSIVNAHREFTDDSSDVGGFTLYSKGDYIGKSQVSELYGVYKFTKKLTLVSGLQRQNQHTNQHYYIISSFGPFETALGDTSKISNLSFYSSLSLSHQHKYSAEVGLRFNHHSIYGNNTTFTFNPSFYLTAATRISINISTAFKTPSIYQLYSEYGNKSLRPEESINFESSLQWNSSSMRQVMRLTAFKRNINDLIVFYFNPINFESRYINRDKQYDHGLELEHSFSISKKIFWKSNITYVTGHGIEDQLKVDNLYHRPEFSANSYLSFHPTKSWTFIPSIRYIGKRLKGPFDPGPLYLDSYTIWDCYVGYKLNKPFNLFLQLNNITNKEYFDVPGYNNRRFNMMLGVKYGVD